MPEASAVLLDTCAAIWLMNGAPMTGESRGAIEAAQRSGAGVYVSPITAWEIGTLVSKNRLQMSVTPEIWFETLISLPGVRLCPMPPRVLIASGFLPGVPPKDPADRIIAATGREYGYTIVTRDGELVPYAAAGHIAVIAC
jgi:PIN domain nuclease of toxin-antitoxin system